jgi:hypothetical protein
LNPERKGSPFWRPFRVRKKGTTDKTPHGAIHFTYEVPDRDRRTKDKAHKGRFTKDKGLGAKTGTEVTYDDLLSFLRAGREASPHSRQKRRLTPPRIIYLLKKKPFGAKVQKTKPARAGTQKMNPFRRTDY